MGSSFWVGVYPEVCEESCVCQEPGLSPWQADSDTGLKYGEEPFINYAILTVRLFLLEFYEFIMSRIFFY
jgi:hypothetical protein